MLIQALRQLPAEDFQITVPGRLDMEPEYVKQMQKLIRASLLHERAILKGPIRVSLSPIYTGNII